MSVSESLSSHISVSVIFTFIGILLMRWHIYVLMFDFVKSQHHLQNKIMMNDEWFYNMSNTLLYIFILRKEANS